MKTESLKLAPREEIKEKVKEIQQKQVCLQFAKNGTCKLGQNCPIKHDDMLKVETGGAIPKGTSRIHKIIPQSKTQSKHQEDSHVMEDDAEDNIEVTIRYIDYTVETGRAGLVIGRGGMNIRAIQTKTNTEIESPPQGYDTFRIHGSAHSIKTAIEEMKKIIESKKPKHIKDAQYRVYQPPLELIPSIIGNKGRRIKNIEEISKTEIIVPRKGNSEFKIYGSEYEVQHAIREIKRITATYEYAKQEQAQREKDRVEKEDKERKVKEQREIYDQERIWVEQEERAELEREEREKREKEWKERH